MIRDSFLLKINNTLNQSANFSHTDFKIEENSNGNIDVWYSYDKKFYFRFDIPNKTTKITKEEKETTTYNMTVTHRDIEYNVHLFNVQMRPGTVADVEYATLEGVEILLKNLSTWETNLWQELICKPDARKLEELKKEINEMNGKFDSLPEDYFTKEEGEKLKEKLEELESKFTEKLESEIKDKAILVALLKELHVEVEKLKRQTTVLNKRNWFKSFGGKLFTWISKEENRKFLKESKDFLKPLLPEPLKTIL